MKMYLIVLSTVAALFAAPVSSWAQDAAPADAGTNFPTLKDYPAAACGKPQPLPKRPVTTVPEEIQRYNVLIGNYNKTGKVYVDCVNAYVGNANRDMDIIRQKSRAAADEANRPANP